MNDIAKQIGRRIRIRRAVQNLTQAKLAQAIGITQAQLSYLERGERTLHTETLARIAAALACEPTDLINERHRLA
jgi:transcriptional regulator with XRE-family HTH domain